MSAPPPSTLSGVIYATDGRVIANFIRCFSSTCVHCQRPVGLFEEFMVLGPPYCAALHSGCAPLYSYPNAWPHASPVVGFKHS